MPPHCDKPTHPQLFARLAHAGASSLPLRLLATEYGADLVWSEEIIASKIAVCSRVYNERNGAIEFVAKAGGHAVFQTIPNRERVVFQLGCSSAADALRAAGRFSKTPALSLSPPPLFRSCSLSRFLFLILSLSLSLSLSPSRAWCFNSAVPQMPGGW